VDLSVVIPARNEAGNLEPLLAEIRSVLEGRLAYEVIVVDDGSSDETTRCLGRPADTRLRVLRHPRPLGQSAALTTGVRAARAPWVVTLDGDGQNDPADIPRLLAVRDSLSSPPDLRLVGGRRSRRRDGPIRRISSRVANAFRAGVLHDGTADTGCGLKLFPRETFLSLPAFDHMHRFLPALVRRGGGQVAFVDVRHRPRRYGRSKYGIRDRLWAGIVDTFGVLWLTRRALAPGSREVTDE
jgi:dolichol-phosphate mannosyltransferase